MCLFGEDGEVAERHTYRNAHGLMTFWFELARRYGVEFNLFGDTGDAPLWALARDERVSIEERVTHLASFDALVFMRKDFLRIASAFERVTELYAEQRAGRVWHFDQMAVHIRAAHAAGDVVAIGWDWNSVSCDFFGDRYLSDDEDAGPTPFNLAEAVVEERVEVENLDHLYGDSILELDDHRRVGLDA